MHLTLTTTLSGSRCYRPHYIDEETEGQRRQALSK